MNPNGGTITNHFALSGVGADEIDPNAKLWYVREFVVGFDREVMPNTTVGIRYMQPAHSARPRRRRELPDGRVRVLDQTSDACGSVAYILTNPSSARRPINPALLAVRRVRRVKFDDPVHKYDAVELTLNRRFANNWSVLASYRWSRLRGNFEGFYRDDNGQSDPGISSLYDFPTNDPTLLCVRRQLGLPGDIRFLGDANGILPLDRPHQIKLSRQLPVPDRTQSRHQLPGVFGKPLTPLGRQPGIQQRRRDSADGARRRASRPSTASRRARRSRRTLTVQASYVMKLGGAATSR